MVENSGKLTYSGRANISPQKNRKFYEVNRKIKELEFFENTWVGHLYDEA